MRTSLLLASACTALVALTPADAAIQVFANQFDLTNRALTVGLDSANQFTFRYDPRFLFDTDPVSVQTTGTAATTAFGGFLGIQLQPSTFFSGANVFIDENIFPGFVSFPTETRVPTSLVEGDLGLRVTIAGLDYFGFARIAGPTITVAFNDIAGAGITAGAIPEPASWAMMITGFGAIGAVARRRSNATVAV